MGRRLAMLLAIGALALSAGPTVAHHSFAMFDRDNQVDLEGVTPSSPAVRREEIKLQVALIHPLIHVKGHTAPDTTKAVERARQLIEKAEVLGEAPEDPLLLFSVLYGLRVGNYVAGNGNIICDLADKFLALAENKLQQPHS